jgi:hypothetical protein
MEIKAADMTRKNEGPHQIKNITSSASVVRWLTLHSSTLNSLTNDSE